MHGLTHYCTQLRLAVELLETDRLKVRPGFRRLTTDDNAEAPNARYGATLEACKTRVRKIFEEEKESWPADARNIKSGIVKMRDTGLRTLRRKLETDRERSRTNN